eukprot:6415500-Pyramimonas_sp.AAC.1
MDGGGGGVVSAPSCDPRVMLRRQVRRQAAEQQTRDVLATAPFPERSGASAPILDSPWIPLRAH